MMPIITISRGSYSMGEEVAEGVAARLGYQCISREVLLAASEKFDVPEVRLLHAICDPPTVLERLGHSTAAYLVYIQSALLDFVRKDNVVYHGLAGHLLLKAVAPVLRVRVIADLSARIALVSERENVSLREARKLISRIDQGRRRWTRGLHGVDPWDSSLYDLVISIEKIGLQGTVDLICQAVAGDSFKLTEAATRKLKDLALACKVKSHLLDIEGSVEVTAEYGNVLVRSKVTDLWAGRLEDKVEWIRSNLDGINHIEVRTRRSRLRSDR